MKKYSINFLTESFFYDHSRTKYPEIERKRNRPYMFIALRIEGNYFAIPFRTNINHKYSYRFGATGRKTVFSTGVDFTKAVIVDKESYIGEKVKIDKAEYNELRKKYFHVIAKFKKYVKGYITLSRKKVDMESNYKYRYSTLRYYHKELGIK